MEIMGFGDFVFDSPVFLQIRLFELKIAILYCDNTFLKYLNILESTACFLKYLFGKILVKVIGGKKVSGVLDEFDLGVFF